ncbi:hypothetical protein [Anaerotruncus rubiinfantis]|uniref:hypothetical protein n=1 Tax=Anaerotruncus rubiinfantis TaxID=1720200 RepID=UPI0034A43C5A
MKTFGKRALSLCLSLVLVLGLCVVASAATTAASPVYGLTVQNKNLLFTQNGQTVGTFTARDTKLTLTTDKDKDFLVCYYDANNKYRAVSLGKQTSLVIGGKMDALTVNKALNDKITITTASNSEIGTFKVASPNTVRIQGKVGTLTVTDAAKITLASSAKVTSKSLVKTAKLTTEKGAQSGTAKPAVTTKPSTGAIKVKADPIEADDGDKLRDLLEDLNDNVYAYDSKTDDEISGTCEWVSSGSREVTKDGTFSFTFIPDDRDYDPVKGSVKIYVDGAFGEIDLVYDGGHSVKVASGTKMKELKDWLKDNVYAEDDNGDEVKGSIKWSYGSSDKIERSRTYKFTFKPSSSKYDDEDGEIDVIVVDSGADIG